MASKVFEVGDVLPANDQIRISWTQSLGWGTPQDLTSSYINGLGGSNSLEIFIDLDDGPIIDFSIYTADNSYYIVESYGDFISPYTNAGGGHAYCDIVLNSPVTITNVDLYMDLFTWEAIGNDIPQGYSVTFEENGGTSVTDLTEQTALPSPLPTTTKTNNIFVGWFYDNLFTQKANAGDELTANVTLYAKWYANMEDFYEDVADAIRSKNGETEPIKHTDFAYKIKNI